jgi:progressive ankylosis protein
MKFPTWFSQRFNAKSSTADSVSLMQLWQQFLPLSLSDVTMAFGDPLMTITLAHLPDARVNLAGVGIAKALAVFFESPIIMILHASNTLAPTIASRRALWRFVLLLGSTLSLLLMLLALPIVFTQVGSRFLGVPIALSPIVQQTLMVMGLWPFVIAWRRYFQGLLIHYGYGEVVAQASILRLLTVAAVLSCGFAQKIPGSTLAGLALMIGVIVEAIAVTVATRKYPGAVILAPPVEVLPSNMPEVFSFYWPLANSMLVVWGGRALLIGVISRAQDASLALAAWPAAWGLILVIANSTRMVQQIVIKYRGKVSDLRLLKFTLMVGSACSLLLLMISTTPLGDRIIQGFIGSDRDLIDRIKPVLLFCTGIPLLVAVQNATQGFLVSEKRTGTVNFSTWLGTASLLIMASTSVRFGVSGSVAAAIAMSCSMVVEVACLLLQQEKFKGFGILKQ